MEYLTYEEYTNLGGTLDLTAFNRNITRAFGIVENATYGRIRSLYGVPKEVKALCRDLTEFLAANEGTAKTVQSFSQNAGGVSESVSFANATEADITSHVDSMIYDYLHSVRTKNGISVIYKGACDIIEDRI